MSRSIPEYTIPYDVELLSVVLHSLLVKRHQVTRGRNYYYKRLINDRHYFFSVLSCHDVMYHYRNPESELVET